VTPAETVTLAYLRWDAGDLDGLLALFADDAMFIVPGSTSVSGTHDKASFRAVLDAVGAATRAGRHRQELVCRYEGDSGIMAIFDTFVGDDCAEQYHSAHEWVFRDGTLHAWMLYVHEYDVFDSAWA
jgi:ketosteroid isomerase-like protein